MRTESKYLDSDKYFLNIFSDIFTEDIVNKAEEEFALYQIDKLNEIGLNCERDDTDQCKIVKQINISLFCFDSFS